LKEDNLNSSYNDLITKFCEICRNLGIYSEEEIKDIHTKIVKILVIRHAVIHHGFPNIFPIVLKEENIRNQPPITKNGKKDKFSQDYMIEVIAWYSNPKNFIEAKSEFDFLISAMDKGPGISVIF